MPWYKWRLNIIFLEAVLLWIFFLWIFFASQPSQVICLSCQMTLWIFSLFARQMHKTTLSFVFLKLNLKPMSYLCLRWGPFQFRNYMQILSGKQKHWCAPSLSNLYFPCTLCATKYCCILKCNMKARMKRNIFKAFARSIWLAQNWHFVHQLFSASGSIFIKRGFLHQRHQANYNKNKYT